MDKLLSILIPFNVRVVVVGIIITAAFALLTGRVGPAVEAFVAVYLVNVVLAAFGIKPFQSRTD